MLRKSRTEPTPPGGLLPKGAVLPLRKGLPQDEESLQKLVDGMPAEVAVVDAEWRILTANSAWLETARTHAHGALLWVGQSFLSFCEWNQMTGAPESRALIGGIRAIEQGDARQFLRTYKSSFDGHYYHVSISRLDAGGDAPLAIVSRIKMTELFQLRRERLRLSASLMRAQASLMRVQEEERQRVARELHDTAAQYLVGMNLAVARLRVVRGEAPVAAVADDLAELLDQLHRDLRGLTYLLHPPQLEHIGLHAAVESLCQGFARRAGLDIALRVHGRDRRSGSAVESAIYRIVQEALSNIHRHAHARHVRIRLCDRPEALFVVIEDDGVGLPGRVDAGQDEVSILGVGIAGMCARVAELGGRLVVRHRAHSSGTIVAAAMPREGAGQAFVMDAGVMDAVGARARDIVCEPYDPPRKAG